MANEIWKDIPGYEGFYQISNTGKVKSLTRVVFCGERRLIFKEKILKQIIDHGYMRVSLSKQGKIKRVYVHRIIAEAFIPNPQNKPQINHIDGNKSNNILDNIEWVTNSENCQHAYDTGLNKIRSGENSSNHKLCRSDIIIIRKLYRSSKEWKLKEIAMKFNISTHQASMIINKKAWAHIK